LIRDHQKISELFWIKGSGSVFICNPLNLRNRRNLWIVLPSEFGFNGVTTARVLPFS
jgi:hypothetical protein